MTPKEYLDRYTWLFFIDPSMGIFNLVSITSYGSGWGTTERDNRPTGFLCQQEYNGPFKTALKFGLDPRGHANIPAAITFPEGAPLAETFRNRTFMRNGLIRAFLGKGTPEEIRDVLQLAIATCRVGAGRDLASHSASCVAIQEYARKFISLDCNGLVGNYYGLNPETSIEHYAAPSKRRRTPQEVQQGDCLVTVRADGSFEHIALIESFVVGAGTPPRCTLKIVEWGQAGDESHHFSTVERSIVQGPDARYGIGFRSGQNNQKFRYIFAPPRDAAAEPRTRGIGGDPSR